MRLIESEAAVRTVSVEEACSLLAGGGVVAYPTETFYAVGCDARCASAVERVYAMKGRPVSKPLPLLVGSRALAEKYFSIEGISERVLAFWPAPLTLLLHPKGRGLAAPASPDGCLAVRVTPHPLAAQLSNLLGAPLTSSSANLSGGIPARLPQDIEQSLEHAVDAIVGCGSAEPAGGEPSTLVRLDGTQAFVLRRGAFPLEKLESVGCQLVADGVGEEQIRPSLKAGS